MSPEQAMQQLAQQVFRQKEARRRALAALPFEEKIALLVRWQLLGSDIVQEARGQFRPPWPLDE